MPQITLSKAAFYPLDSRVIHPSGTVLDVTEEDEAVLRSRGVVADDATAAPADSVEPVPVPAPEPAPEAETTATTGVGKYPPLPAKTAPVARWREYAKDNGIKLTGLTKRNEIMGYIIKVAEQ